MLNFNFLEKGLGLAFPPHFVYDFSQKKISRYILLTYQISSFGCLYFLDNICFAIVCFPICDVINFEINLSFLIKSFFYMNKRVRSKKFLRTKRALKMK